MGRVGREGGSGRRAAGPHNNGRRAPAAWVLTAVRMCWSVARGTRAAGVRQDKATAAVSCCSWDRGQLGSDPVRCAVRRVRGGV